MSLSDRAGAWAQEMASLLSTRRVVAFVGAGVSMPPPALVPGWRHCFQSLCNIAQEFGKPEVASRALSVADLTGYEPRYLTVGFEELRRALGDQTYHREMQRILEPRSRTDFSGILAQVVRLPFWAFITTNVDTLLEDASLEAVRAGDRSAHLRASVDAEQISQEIGHQNNGWLWKLHGTIDKPSSWIFTSEEYWRSIYATRYTAHRQLISNVAQTYHLLFIGFGGSDPEVDIHLSHVAEVFGGQQRRHYLLAREMSPQQKHDLSSRNIDVVEYRGPADHSALEELLRLVDQLSMNGRSRTTGPGAFEIYSDWLCAQTRTVDLRRIAGGRLPQLIGRPIGVDEVFVELCEEVRPTNLQRAASGNPTPSKRNMTDLIVNETSRGLAVIGPGGCGKSTLLKRVAQKLLEAPSAPMPIYIRLPELFEADRGISYHDARTAKERSEAFLSRASLLLPDAVVKSGALGRWVHSHPCIWLLDGLDEVRNVDDQRWVLSALDACVREWSNSRFVVASRQIEVFSNNLPPTFEVSAIDVLSDERIAELTTKWVGILMVNREGEERNAVVDQFMTAFEMDPGFRQLSRSPVMLTSIVLVQLTPGHGELPRAKSEVLRAVVAWLLGARTHAVGNRELDSELVEQLYEDLALLILSSGKDRLGIRETASELARQFASDQSDAIGFLNAEQDVGLLERKGRGDIGFSVPHIQEYLAASGLARRSDNPNEGWWFAVKDHVLDPHWSGMLSLLPSILALGGDDRAALFFQRVAEKFHTEDLGIRAQAYSVAARAFIGLRSVAVDPPSTGHWANLHRGMSVLFSVMGLEIPLRTRVLAASAYGWVGDERFGSSTDLWVPLPAGESTCGAQAGSPQELGFDALALPWETPRTVQFEEFQIRRYLVTVQEYYEFVHAGGYRNRQFWVGDGWQWLHDQRITKPGNWYQQLETPNAPVTELSYFEASAYCRWLSHVTVGFVVRLPGSDEWEYAARRSDIYRRISEGSWTLAEGDQSLANWLGTSLWHKTPVGVFPESLTDDGVADMIGNVEEWCRDMWLPGLLDPEQERGLGVAMRFGYYIVRGGSAIRASRLCRPTYFSRCRAEGRYPTIGFRPVRLRTVE